MQARPASKYHLKDLYQEIGFYDRKIATAMASTGVECDPSQLPRSMKSAESST